MHAFRIGISHGNLLERLLWLEPIGCLSHLAGSLIIAVGARVYNYWLLQSIQCAYSDIENVADAVSVKRFDLIKVSVADVVPFLPFEKSKTSTDGRDRLRHARGRSGRTLI